MMTYTSPLPTANTIFNDLAIGKGTLSVARALVSFAEASGAQVCVYEDRRGNAPSTLLIGEKPNKESGAKRTWTFPVCGTATEGEDFDARLRLIVIGTLDEEQEQFLTALSESVVLEHAERVVRLSLTEEAVSGLNLQDEAPVKYGIVTGSDHTCRMIDDVELYAIETRPVLINGESGTGKEMVASALHQASKRTGQFLALNCGSIPSDMIAAELFGHVKGSFTGASHDKKGLFEAANKGTLFLDEIGEMPLAQQVLLLRVLQEGKIRRVGDAKEVKVNVRVVAATNRNLEEMVAEGSFREDLYYRLRHLTITIAPLRERSDEVPHLVNYYLKKLSAEKGRQITITSEAMSVLQAQEWRGNIRELVCTLDAAALHARGEDITPDVLALKQVLGPEVVQGQTRTRSRLVEAGGAFQRTPSAGAAQQVIGENAPYDEQMKNFERQLLQNALTKAKGNVTLAAQSLSMPRETMRRRIKDLGVMFQIKPSLVGKKMTATAAVA